MAINIKFDTAGNPEPPSIILATKNGNKLGLLDVNADSIELNDKLKVSEISFTLNKYIDGKLNNLWDKVVDFKLIWCKEWDTWFEIKVELDEATEIVKTVFGIQLGQAELSQIMVYNMEINTEEDIVRDDYKITILYDENDHEASLLHRVLKDKAPHYSIAYVDPTIARIQRQFSWDGSSICDVLDEIEEEIGCLVVYNSNSTKGGMPNRSISVYDLEQNCNDCGHRGEFTDKCPKCGSKNIKSGYGEDTTIFVTADELASEGIQLVADVDSVKNCFKLEAGDDLMTATIRNCNPNGSDYIWRFSNDTKEDMSDELVEKLEGYDAEYKRYYNEYESNLDATLLTQYNNLVEKYDDFYNTDSTCLNCDNKGEFYDKCPSCNSENLLTGKELQKISTPIAGYPSLMNAYYNTIDFALYLKSGLMPSIVMSDTTAEEQASLLTASSLSPVAVNVKEASSISPTTADSAVLSMAKIIVKSTYKVEILSSSLSTEKKWSGTFKVTNYSDDTDTAEVVVNDIVVNNDAEAFIKQKIEKALNKEDTDDYSISGLFEKELVVTVVNDETVYSGEFYEELKKYALKPLQSFYDAADACISILTEQGAGDETNKPDLYENLYLPYFQKQEAIASEINIRKNELAIIEGIYDETTKTTSDGLQNNIRNRQSVIQDALNFEDYLGEDLWKEFCSFRREDKYSNSNYISDGLNNAQLFERALEFLDVAENETYKSSELQHSISTSLNNLLAIDKFKPLVKYFKNGNWIRVRVDDKIYKLRLLEYGINFGSFESISVEFSDVIKIKNSTTDVKDILEQASSVASSYDAVTRQAKKGNVAKSTIEQWIDEGLNAANVQIQSNNSEEILITKNGLLGRSYDDITGTYSPEQLKITHNIMAYTDDNWETVKQAIGKHKYSAYDKELGEIVDNKIGYGMSAEFVTAGVVSGSQIIGGDIYSDNYSITGRTGSYLNLRDGTFSFGGGALRFEGGELLISSPNVVTKNEVTTINEEYLKTTSVYAENLKVNAAYIQEKLTAAQINTEGLIAENISSTTIDGKTITGGSILIGDATKVNDYAEISKDGALTCTNVNIQGGILQIGSKNNKETHTWITSDGTLNTYNANISGEIRATKGMIGGFAIEPIVTNEDGNDSGGWLYSSDKTLGDDKSIFLSATDMSGTVSRTPLTDWRLTIGENFGVASDGTSYMSNCEITGGSLRIGTEDSGYYAWISENGVLNAGGANINGTINAIKGNIAGWKIDETEICSESTFVGLSSSSILAQSLISSDKESPVRIYAGEQIKDCDNIYYETLDSYGNISKTITVSETGGKIKSVNIESIAIKSDSAFEDGSDDGYEDSKILTEAATATITSDSTISIKIETNSTLDFGEKSIKIELKYVYGYGINTSSTMILEDGSLYANAAYIKGNGIFEGDIYARNGEIGDLKIDRGIKGYVGDIESFSLTTSGLNLNSSDAKISVGNFELYHDSSQAKTFINANGALSLCGKQEGSAITSIDLMTDNGEDVATYGLSLYCISNKESNVSVYLKTSDDSKLRHNITVTLYCEGAKAVLSGTHSYSESKTRTATLTINGGENHSNTVKFNLDEGNDTGFWGTFVRFKCFYENTWLCDWIGDKELDALLGLVGECGSITQSQTKASILITGNLIPSKSNTYSIGRANDGDTNLWSTIYAQTGSIQQSDRVHKNNIQNLSENYGKIFDGLQPVSYKFNENKSNRTHLGFIAQDVKRVVEDSGFTTQDFAGYCEWTNSNGEIGCGLRYEEFIALCVDQIQKLKKRVAELENK